MAAQVVSYEERRRLNLEDNKRILAQIGLLNPFKDKAKVNFKRPGIQRKTKRPSLDNNRKKTEIKTEQQKRPLEELDTSESNGGRRKSARLQGQSTPKRQIDYDDDDDEENWEDNKSRNYKRQTAPRIKFSHVKVEKNRPNVYGAIEGVDVGVVWPTRMECCRDGIHRPPVSGIHGGVDGAYSIALSGGYDDNVDWGDCFTYTGEGGRDLKGTAQKPKNLRQAEQSKDQTLTRGNLALSKNVETGNPVRVIRGYKLPSAFAPEEGYRYDGLYSVEKAWFTQGAAGFGVWKFAMKRLDNQPPPPWEFINSLEQSQNLAESESENSPINEGKDETDKDVQEVSQNLAENGSENLPMEDRKTETNKDVSESENSPIKDNKDETNKEVQDAE